MAPPSRKIARLFVLHRCAALLVAAMCGPSLAAAQGPEPTADEFFNGEELHELRLTIHSRDWEQLKERYRENTYYPADLHWRDLVVQNVGIRSRGFGSRNPTKPGLRVDINRYASGQQFLGLKSFVLDNLAQDPSMLRERVSFRFFERMRLPAPRATHARLLVNNEYVGVYGVVESIDQAFLKRVFGRDPNGGFENDGHLFEYKYIEEQPYFYGCLGWDLDAYARRFEPKTHERDPVETLYRPIEEMIRIVNHASSFDFERLMADYLDLTVFMRQVAVENFLAEWDGILGFAGANNFYLYRFEGTKRSQFIPWDKDNTFHELTYSTMAGVQPHMLMNYAMQFPGPYGTYMQTLLDAAAAAAEQVAPAALAEASGTDLAPGWLEYEIRKAYEQIREAALADSAKPWTNGEFETAMTELVTFARERGTLVRCDVYRSIDPSRVGAECR